MNSISQRTKLRAAVTSGSVATVAQQSRAQPVNHHAQLATIGSGATLRPPPPSPLPQTSFGELIVARFHSNDTDLTCHKHKLFDEMSS